MTEQELSFVVSFIKQNKELFETNNWDEIYKKASSRILPTMRYLSSLLTLLAEEFDIDPLNYLSYVPSYFMTGNEKDRYIYLPTTIENIQGSAFSHCTGLTSITIGNGVTSIGNFAFEGCTGLTSVTIPDSVTSIGTRAFYDCTNLQYNTYDNAQYLGNSQNPYVVLIKANNTSITSCNIHANTKVIYESAFSDCTGLTSITIPNSVKNIGYGAFRDCTGLTKITIPNSVTSIGNCSFLYCTGLTNITYQGTKAQWTAISPGLYWNNHTGNYTIHCTDGDIKKR